MAAIHRDTSDSFVVKDFVIRRRFTETQAVLAIRAFHKYPEITHPPMEVRRFPKDRDCPKNSHQ